MSDAPQFGTAEYKSIPGADQCKTCGQPISGQYFRVSGAITCPACAEKTAGMLPKDNHSVFVRGLVFGLIGAVIGLALYSAVGIITGLEIGYASLAVGYIVGRAVLFGSAGIGGRRYQIMAALLTYAAVSMSAVPIGLSQMIGKKSEAAAVTREVNAKPEDIANKATSEEDAPPGGLLGAILVLGVVGLISPFLGMMEPLSGLIGLVILFVGLRIAWTMTGGNPVKVMGPYTA